MKTILSCIFLTFTFIGNVFAQSASETAKAYHDLLKDGKYRDAAEMFEPGALVEIRKQLDFGTGLPKELAKQFYPQFFGAGATGESVSNLSDVEFFSRFLASLARQGKQVGVNPFGRVDILGEVPEGKGVAHVLTRQFSAADPTSGKLEVMSFRKTDGKWKAMLGEDLKRLADQPKKAFQMLKKALEAQEKASQP